MTPELVHSHATASLEALRNVDQLTLGDCLVESRGEKKKCWLRECNPRPLGQETNIAPATN